MAKTRKLYSDDPALDKATRAVGGVEWSGFNPQQKAFVTSRKPFICGAGGKGGGKTVGLVRRALILLSTSDVFGDMSGNTGLIGRCKEKDFIKTTLPELRRWIPPSWIRKEYKKDGVFELVNESLLHYTHFDDVDHIVSYNLGFAALDQMEQVSEEVIDELIYNRIRMRILTRYDRTGNLVIPLFNDNADCISPEPEKQAAVLDYHSVFGVANPRRGWIYRRFIQNEEFRTSPDERVRARYNPDYEFIQIPTQENRKYLPKDYIERQRRERSSAEYKRNVTGDWDAFEGQVYCDFNDTFILPKNLVPMPEWDIYIGIDHGGTGYDKTGATGVTAVDFAALEPRSGTWPKLHVFDELYLQGSTVQDTVAEIDERLKALRTAQKYHYENVPATPVKVKAWRSGADVMRGIQDAQESIMERYMKFAKMRGLFMPLAIGGNDQAEKIERTNWFFREGLLDVNPSCIHTIGCWKGTEYGSNGKIKAMQDDHNSEAFDLLHSAVPVRPNMIRMPEQLESREQTEMRRYQEGLAQEGDDPVYGTRYAV